VHSSQTLTVSNVISGTGSLSFNPQVQARTQPATVTLLGANTFTGGVTLAGGVTAAIGSIIVGNNSALGMVPTRKMPGPCRTTAFMRLRSAIRCSSTPALRRGLWSPTIPRFPSLSPAWFPAPPACPRPRRALANPGRVRWCFTSPVALNNSVTVFQGTLALAGGGSLTASSFIVDPGATLLLDNSTTNNANRLGDSMPITLNGGKIDYRGNNTAGFLSTENLWADQLESRKFDL